MRALFEHFELIFDDLQLYSGQAANSLTREQAHILSFGFRFSTHFGLVSRFELVVWSAGFTGGIVGQRAQTAHSEYDGGIVGVAGF